MFFQSASEEREHALKIIEYLLMRGQLTNDVSKLLKFPLVSIFMSISLSVLKYFNGDGEEIDIKRN